MSSETTGLKLVGGVWLPATEEHISEWMTKENQRVDGKLTYQLNKQQAFLSRCRGRRRFIDIGAHCGLWSMNLQKHFKRVDAFEPVAIHQDCFEKNVAIENVTLWKIALGESDGMVAMSMRNGPHASGETGIGGEGDIPMHRLDDISNFSDVDGIKLDCEGYELFALRGAEQLIRRCMPTIIVEQKVNQASRFGVPDTGAVTFLKKLGYKVAYEKSGDYVCVPRSKWSRKIIKLLSR